MKRFTATIIALTLIPLPGCVGQGNKQYSKTYYDVFDTVTTLTAQAKSEAEFNQTADQLHAELLKYHKLFDIYNVYPGTVNLYIINETANIAPVSADKRIIELLLDCKAAYSATSGKINAAMGSVLQLWHEARASGLAAPEYAILPDQSQLEMAATHTDFDSVIIDTEASTVYFSDPLVQLDVGAIAKGWATQKVAETAPEGWLLNVGGNVCATGPKADASPWTVAIQDPSDPNAYLLKLSINGGCVATSGDYQRTYLVDGKLYHHIIDPETLYPSEYWRSVSVVCDDSGLADALSTALFILPQEEGQKLLEQCGAEAMWLDGAGNRFYSPGFEAMIRT